MNAIELTRQLVRFDTRNPPGDEDACARFLADRLEAAGFDVQAYEFAEGRTNLIARGHGRTGLKGQGAGVALPIGRVYG